MNIHLITIGKRMPSWINKGFNEYASRLPQNFHLHLTEINARQRRKGQNIDKLIQQESKALLAAIPQDNYVIALDRQGQSLATLQLAELFCQWRDQNQDVSLLIGGPEGLNQQCLAKADARWSLSALTLAHPLVRLVIAEQIYRVWSIMSRHPYHR